MSRLLVTAASLLLSCREFPHVHFRKPGSADWKCFGEVSDFLGQHPMTTCMRIAREKAAEFPEYEWRCTGEP